MTSSLPSKSAEERQARRDERWRKWEERDRQEKAEREAERARRGNPQRFTLTGMIAHHHEWEEDGQTVRDTSWSLPSIDPRVEQNEVIRVVEEAAYERLREAARAVVDEFGWSESCGSGLLIAALRTALDPETTP